MKSALTFSALALSLSVGLVATGCGGDSPTGTTPPDPSVPKAVEVTPGTATLVSLGDTLMLSATVRNGSGGIISTSPAWSSSDATVATVDTEGRVLAVGNGQATVTATAGTASGSSRVTVQQAVDSVATDGDAQGGEVGSPLDSLVALTAFDARRNPVAGAPVLLQVLSGGGSVSPASVDTDAEGRAEVTWTLGLALGVQELEATLGHDSEQVLLLSATGFPMPAVAMSAYAGDGQTELPGLGLPGPLEVLVTDSLGNGVPDMVVIFEVDGDAALEVAEVVTDLDGVARVELVLGSNPGDYTVQAAVPDSLTPSGSALIGSPVQFQVTAVDYSADPVAGLTVGDTVTLTGSGFHPVPDSNSVTLDGLSASILEGSQSSLTIQVPAFGCTPLRSRELSVSRTGQGAVQAVPVQPADPVDLQVGELQSFSDPGAFCLQFMPGTDEEYLVGLTATRWFDASATFEVTAVDSIGPDPAPLRLSSDVGTEVTGSGESETAGPLTGEEALRRQEAALIEALSSPELSFLAAETAGVPPVEGDMLSLRVPDIRGDACTEYLPVNVEVFYGGANIILATSAALPSPGTFLHATLIEAAQSVVDDFGQFSFNLLLATLGVEDLWTVDSRILVVFVPEVGPMGVSAFASAVDQLPGSTCPSSDEDRIIYVRIPQGVDLLALVDIIRNAPPDIAHHTAHILQWGDRLPTGGNLLPSWLAEGQAETVVELIGLARTGLWGQEEINSAVAGAFPLAVPKWFRPRFDRLARYQGWDGGSGKLTGAPEGCSLFGFRTAAVCASAAGPGAAWSFVRYLADRFGPDLGGEAGLQQVIMQLDPVGDPIEDLEGSLQASLADLMVEWAATLYVDGRLTPAQAPNLQITRWDVQSWMGAGQALVPEARGFADFGRLGSVLGGGTAYTLIGDGSAHGPLAVSVGNGAGGGVSALLEPRLWVVRMR